MIKAAVVGVTGFGGTHYNDLIREYEAGRVQPVAAVVINPEEAAAKVAKLQEIGCDILPDFDSLISKYAGKLDICCIPTGIALHKPMSVAAVEAGFNVFVEKPVAATVAEVNEMTAAAKKYGKFIAVGFQNMYQSETLRIKEILLSGMIGKPQSFKCYAMWPRHFAYYNRNKWAGRILGGNGEAILDSPFTNALAHDLNLQLFYAGKTMDEMADVVSVQSVLMRANDIESCDTASIKCITSDGCELLFNVTHAANCLSHPLHIIKCENGELHTNRAFSMCKVFDQEGNLLEEVPFDTEPRRNIWTAMSDRINGKKSFICTPEMAGIHTLVSNAAFDSAPVINFPEDLVSTVTFDETGVERRVVRGIEKILRRTFDENRLFNEDDFSFVRPGKIIDLKQYNGFQNIQGYGK